MISGAAATHGVFFETSPSEGGLARVVNMRFRARDRVDILPGKGSDAGESPDEIEK